MTVTLWLDTDAEETIELGATLPFYQAWAEIVRAGGKSFSDDYPDLAGVVSQCEDQEDADADWLADVRLQAADVLKEHGDSLSDRAQAILSLLAGDDGASGDKGLSPEAATFAEADSFDFGDISLGGLSREEIAEILIDAALDARDDASFGFDPNEARDEQGRWTTGGVGGVIAEWHAQETRLGLEGASEEELQPLRQTLEKAQAAVEKKHTVYSELAGKLKEVEANVKQLEAAEPAEPQAKDYPPEPEEPELPEEPTPAQEQAYDRWDRDYAKWVDARAKVDEEHGRALDRWERTIDRVRSRRDSLEERTDAAHEKLDDTIYAWQEKIDEKVAEAEGTLADRQAQNAEFAGWDEAKHPRGQPGNRGKFGPGGGADNPHESRDFAIDVHGELTERPNTPIFQHPVRKAIEDRIVHLLQAGKSRSKGEVSLTFRPVYGMTSVHQGDGIVATAYYFPADGKVLVSQPLVGGRKQARFDEHTPPAELEYKLRKVLGLKVPPEVERQYAHINKAPKLADSEAEAAFDNAEFYDPNQLRDHRGRWATGGGGGASQGLPHAERQAQRESAKETVRRFMAGKGTPSIQEASGLAQALSTLTVAQIHEVKREHGLKASSKDKAGLVAKLAERFRAAREAKPAEAKPSEKKPAESNASDLRREAVKSAIGDTYSRYNGTHLLLQEIAARHKTLAGALSEAERQGLIDTRQRSPQADVSPLQRDRQGEWVRRVLGQAYGEKEAEAKPGERFLEGRPIGERIAAYKGGEAILQAFADHAARNVRMVKAFEETGQHWQKTVDAYQQTLAGQDQAYRDGDEAAVNRLTEDLRRLAKERTAAERAYDDARAQFDANRDDGKKLLLEQLKPMTAHKVELLQHPDLPKQQQEYGRKAADFLSAVLTKTLHDPELLSPIHAPVVKNDPDDRAHYQGKAHGADYPLVRTEEHDWENVSVHELGHHVENELPGVQDAAREFLAHRVGNEPLTKLSEKFPDSKFKDYETGRKDDFEKLFGKDSSNAYYAGKDYPGRNDTEIVSMGIEKLHQDPTGFAHKDPEYFKFMVGILKGDLRGGQP